MPPKSDVLATLDENEPMPPRKARAVLVLGKANPPSVKEVLVTVTYVNGSAVASHLQSSNIQSSKWESLPYYQRPMGLLDDAGVANALDEVEDKLNEFLMSALDGFSYGGACEVTEKCIEWTITHCQHINKDIPRGTYVQFYWRTIVSDGNYLHPIPLQMLIAGKGKHLKTWYVFKVWFNGNWYDSVEELLQAWKKNTYGLRDNFKFVFPDAAQSLFANFEPRPGPKRGVEQPVGPLAWEPYGRRFTITGGNRVDWLGWSLYVGYTPSFGPRYWDLRFKGERIAYEISMQEAMAKYGADDLTQANAVFLDSAFGLGYNLRELMQGVDCPMTAAFMDATIFHGGMTKPQTFKNAICIFEQNPDTPVLRHYSSAFQFYGAVPGAKLVVRMISTVYNYDYIQDLLLNVDGTVDVKVVTSGYILATTSKNFYPKHFGYPVFYNVSGTVHTHVLAWKADIDIAGTANSVKLHNLKLTQADNGAGGKIYMQKYDSKTCKKEEDSAFVSVVYEPKIPVVVNEDEPNSWGSPRGYKVQFNKLIANLEPPEYERSKGLGFWKWNFVATKYKDGETHSSSPYNQIDLANPAVNLCDYVDGDSIRRKDVVVWINSGLYHIPISEDAPSTATSGNELGFSLIPFNWADANSATDMVNMVQFTPNNTNNTSTFINEATNKCSPSYTQVPFLKDGFAADEDEDAAVPYRDNMSYEPEQDSEGLMSVATAAATKTAAAKPAQKRRCRSGSFSRWLC